MRDNLHRLASKLAHWHAHVNHVQAPADMRHWLTDRGSLTAKLIAHSNQFRVQRISQHHDFCWGDEFAQIGLAKPGVVHTRDVLLRCDERPVVYAHTVVPLSATATQWPLFKALGNKSLGSTLFGDPLVVRGAMQYARLQPNHPAMQRAFGLTREDLNCGTSAQFTRPLYARRSLFYRLGGVMLVTELFLPTIAQLSASSSININVT